MIAKQKREVVAITGASAGVGRATVREFARRGAHIGLLARGTDGLKAAQAEVEREGGKALVIPTDVASADAVEAAARAIEDEFGPIDIWINNAMVSVFSPFKKMNPDEYRRVTEVTYLGYVWGTMSALKRMLVRDQGTIVQVGSGLAYRAIPLQSAYCGAKHAVEGFTESIRSELLHDNSNVHITMVQLPAVNTPQFSWVKSRLPRKPQPVPPIYQPEVIAESIYWAAHQRLREVNVGFSTSAVITLNKFFPGIGDRYLAMTGYESQQYDGEVSPDRADNLWKPLPGDHGAHGEFDDRSHNWSPQFWLVRNRRWIAGALGVLAAAGLVTAMRKSQGEFSRPSPVSSEAADI